MICICYSTWSRGINIFSGVNDVKEELQKTKNVEKIAKNWQIPSLLPYHLIHGIENGKSVTFFRKKALLLSLLRSEVNHTHEGYS